MVIIEMGLNNDHCVRRLSLSKYFYFYATTFVPLSEPFLRTDLLK